MAPPANLFALLNDDVEDGRKDIEVAVAVREEEKKVEATEKKKEAQKKKREKTKKERSRALDLPKKTYLRAKRLVLPAYVIRSQIIVRKDKPAEPPAGSVIRSQIFVKKDKPAELLRSAGSVIRSQIVVPEDEVQDGKTALSNAATQNHNNGVVGGRSDRRDYGRSNGGNGRRNIPSKVEVEENNNGKILVDEEGFQMVRSRRSNGGNGRSNVGNGRRNIPSKVEVEENNNGKILVDEEGFQMVRSRRSNGGNGRSNVGNGRRNIPSKKNNGEILVDKEGFQRRSNGQTNLFTEAAVLVEANQESRKDVESNGESGKKPAAADEEKKNSNEENRADKGKGKGKRPSSNKGIRFDKSLEEKEKSKVKVYTLKEYESRLQKMKGGSPPAKEMRSSNMPVIGKEEESLDKVLKFKFVYPHRRWSDEVEKESSKQLKELVPVPEPEPEPETEPEPTAKPEPVPVPGLDQFPELTKKRIP